MAGPGHGLDSLRRSTHRVALTTHRIVEVQDGQGHFPSRNRRQGHRVQTMMREAHECIRRFLVHMLPPGLQRMRPIGFLANRGKARALCQCRQLLDQPADPPTHEKTTVAQWMAPLASTDITRCPHCGHGPLQRTPLPALTLRAGHPSQSPLFDSS